MTPRAQNTMILFLSVFSVSCGFASGILHERVCHGQSYKLPSKRFPTQSNDLVYFTPSHGGPKKLMIDKGKPVDSRIKIVSDSFWLVNSISRDQGTFGVSSDGIRIKSVLMLEIMDCAETITAFYAASLEHDLLVYTELLDYIPRDSLDEPITLWNRTDPQGRDRRRGNIINNVWKIYNLTQADNGFYIFKGYTDSRILLEVKENTLKYERNENEPLVISYPQFGGPWTVIFKPEESLHSEMLMKEGQPLYEFHRFTSRINSKKNAIEIDKVQLKDSGTFEFRDAQGNLALAVKFKVNTVSNDATLIYVAVTVGLFNVGICCFCCCRICCKTDSSTPKTEAAAPTVHYHDPPPTTVPAYSGPVYPSAYPQQPGYQPVNIHPPPVINMNPSQPGYMNTNPVPPAIDVSPPPPGYMNANPIPAGINVSPPSPGVMNVNPFPPGITMNPLQTEGPTSTPTFSSEFLSSDSEPRFELTGFNIPSGPPLSSNTPSCDVYNSDKLNFQ